ncbi:hypothetical protein GCM10010193_45420 [Kitasatospora atroaurantiaca]|uniref:non-specific serine/threonine protein kinase n=1 Tax=Kitasatospora atroaurantiaca TaxID=285545 RepID=A0A561EZP5_9ACTN|nr:serine/threonine-protein kinase [Kitasatospora atroaurantiaca]TWE21076.1 serine/threonine protein kinase [Kitasatospora atroaurantiaca]
MEGQLLSGRYELVEHLSSGGAGVVWSAYDRELGRTVTVKVFAGSDLSPEDTQRLEREARAAAALPDNPHVVTVHDFGHDGGSAFVVMEPVAGRSLDEVLTAGGVPDPARATDWVRQVCAGLEAAHAAGLVHGDIKPATLVLADDGTVKVLDLGSAWLHPAAPGPQRLSGANTALGSVPWMSPEQVRGDGEVDHRSDLYSLGCLLYQLLTGATPFGHLEASVQFGAHLRGTPAAPSRHRAGIPAGLDELVLRLLAKFPEERPASAGEVAALLDALAPEIGAAAASGFPAASAAAVAVQPRLVPAAMATAAPVFTPFDEFEPEPWWRRPSSRRAGLVAGSAALVLALVGGTVWAVGGQSTGADGGGRTKAGGSSHSGAVPVGSTSDLGDAPVAGTAGSAPANTPATPGATSAPSSAAASAGAAASGKAAATTTPSTATGGSKAGATPPAQVPASPATTASAYGCTGGLVDSYPVKTSEGVIFGYFYLYFDNSTGNNCAATIKTANSGYGTASVVKASISRCSNTSASNSCTKVSGTTSTDEGNFAKFAGPVKVSAASTCITGFGSIVWGGVTATTSSTLGNRAVHCG